jgi:hypothetical protein
LPEMSAVPRRPSNVMGSWKRVAPYRYAHPTTVNANMAAVAAGRSWKALQRIRQCKA